MILTKPVLKYLLDKYKESPYKGQTESELQKKVKCLALEYEFTKDETFFDEIILTFLDLCHCTYK